MAHMSIQPNFYRATFRPSIDMIELRTISTEYGYHIVAGKMPDGSLRVQSVLFPKEKYDVSKATITAHYIEKWYK